MDRTVDGRAAAAANRNLETHPRLKANAEQHGHKWAKVVEKIFVGVG